MPPKTDSAARLRLILAQCEAKYNRGAPLTVKEEELLAELYRRQSLKPRETVSVDSETGAVHVRRTVDAEPIMDAMKDYGDFIGRYRKHTTAQKLVGSLDPMTAADWAQKAGLRLGTKEFAQFAVNRIKNDIDYRKFKVGH